MPPPLHRVLYKLEGRNARFIKRHQVRASHAPVGQSRESRVFKRLHPGFEQRIDLQVVLRVNAPEFAWTIIGIEISGDFRMLLQLLLPVLHITLDISGGSIKPLLLASPEDDADGAARLDTNLFQDADSLQHGYEPCAVIPCSRAHLVAIQMSTQQHQFIFQPWVCPRYFRHDIVNRPVAGEVDSDINIHLHLFPVADQAFHQTVVLTSYIHFARSHARQFLLIETQSRHAVIPILMDNNGRLLFADKLQHLLIAQFRPWNHLDRTRAAGLHLRNRVIGSVLQVLFREPACHRVKADLVIHDRRHQDNLSFQASLECLQFAFVLRRDQHHFPSHCATGSIRPSHRTGENGDIIRGSHRHISLVNVPAATRPIASKVNPGIGQSIGSHRLLRNLLPSFHAVRTSQARTCIIEQLIRKLFHLGIPHLLQFDLLGNGEVNCLLLCKSCREA